MKQFTLFTIFLLFLGTCLMGQGIPTTCPMNSNNGPCVIEATIVPNGMGASGSVDVNANTTDCEDSVGDNCGAFLVDASGTNYTTVSFDAGNGTQCNGMADSIYLEIDGQCFRIADGRAEDSVVVLPASKMFRIYVCRNGNGDVGVCDVRGGGAPGADPEVTVAKTDALLIDNNNDGNANPGETIQYTITVDNTQANTVAGMVTFNDVPGANTNLVVGSVITNQGSVTSGNTVGDNTVSVDIGDVAPNSPVTITFNVVISPFFGGTQVCNQGVATGSNFANVSSDDPDTGASGDATCTPVVQLPGGPIPTMSQWAFFLFGLTTFTVFMVGLYNVKKRQVI